MHLESSGEAQPRRKIQFGIENDGEKVYQALPEK
jgi:hypothetical protein